MSIAFSRTLRSLEADRFGASALVLAGAALVLTAWLLWALVARVGVWESSNQARLEVESAPHPVAAPASGRVVKTLLDLDRQVLAGDVLVELEAEDQELQLREEDARLASLESQRQALRSEADVKAEALRRSQQAGRLAHEEARAQLREAEAALAFAVEDARRTERLHAEGLRSEVDLARARTEVEKNSAAVARHRVAIERLEEQYATEERDRRTEIEGLNRSDSELAGAAATAQATVARVVHAVEERVIRSPVAGRLGEVSDLRVGGFVRAGDLVCTVIPDGAPRIVAEFEPQQALGRIKIGQRARLRLDGFPWIQYGAVPATVTGVATERRDDAVRVELELDADPPPAIPLAHGLPGAVEIEVERVTPATLLLRVVGRVVTERDAVAARPVSE